MALVLDTAPVNEPVTTADLKAHARVEISDDDSLIGALGVVARKKLEDDTRRALITQTWIWYLDSFPATSDRPLYVPRPPLQSVTHIKYTDANGDTQTWSSDEYDVDIKSTPARILPAYGYTWPTTRDDLNAVEIKFVAGFGDDAADVDERAVHAIKMLVATWYEHREVIIVGADARTIPAPVAYRYLTMPLRVWRFED